MVSDLLCLFVFVQPHAMHDGKNGFSFRTENMENLRAYYVNSF